MNKKSIIFFWNAEAVYKKRTVLRKKKKDYKP